MISKKKREPKKIQTLVIRDRSCSPGLWLCEAICDGDVVALEILAAWQ